MPAEGVTIALVTGGRGYGDPNRTPGWRVASKQRQTVERALGRLGPAIVVHGGATGADACAAQWLSETGSAQGVECAIPRARWSAMGKGAGPARNRLMLRIAEGICSSDTTGRMRLVCLHFPGGSGTAGMVKLCRESDAEWEICDGEVMGED